MYRNYVFCNSTEALPVLMDELLKLGDVVESRAGATRELRHVGITLTRPLERELLVPGRKPNLAAQVAETMWVLSGRNDVEWLARYLPRATQFSDDGSTWRGAYGKRLRSWERRTPGDVFDQLRWVVDHLREQPNSRRAVMSIYDPDIDSADGLDIPCNDFLMFSQRQGVLDLNVTIRSNDLMWGWSGINAFEWSALLEIVAGLLGAAVGHLHFNIGSLHLYDRHWHRAEEIAKSENPVMETVRSPRFHVAGGLLRNVDDLDMLMSNWFYVESVISRGSESSDFAASDLIDTFPEPMMGSWLRILEWWWSGNDIPLGRQLGGTRLYVASTMAVQPKEPARDIAKSVQTKKFVEYVTNLHNEKHAAYGDSWKKRGEMLGIMANLARKVDRLGVSGGGDTATDTAIDLLVYLAKYRWWLVDYAGAPAPRLLAGLKQPYSDGTEAPNSLISAIDIKGDRSTEKELEVMLTESFDQLEKAVVDQGERDQLVWSMLVLAYRLAQKLWHQEHNATRLWAGYGDA